MEFILVVSFVPFVSYQYSLFFPHHVHCSLWHPVQYGDFSLVYTQVNRSHNDNKKAKVHQIAVVTRLLPHPDSYCFGHDIIHASTNLEYHQLQTCVAEHPQPPHLRSCVNMFNLSLSGDREGTFENIDPRRSQTDSGLEGEPAQSVRHEAKWYLGTTLSDKKARGNTIRISLPYQEMNPPLNNWITGAHVYGFVVPGAIPRLGPEPHEGGGGRAGATRRKGAHRHTELVYFPNVCTTLTDYRHRIELEMSYETGSSLLLQARRSNSYYESSLHYRILQLATFHIAIP